MWKSFNIAKEDVFDKKWTIIGVGVLVGLMGLYVITMFNSLDFSQLEDYINSLPDSMIALLGGELDITNPYSLTSSYFYSFTWSVLQCLGKYKCHQGTGCQSGA